MESKNGGLAWMVSKKLSLYWNPKNWSQVEKSRFGVGGVLKMESEDFLPSRKIEVSHKRCVQSQTKTLTQKLKNNGLKSKN